MHFAVKQLWAHCVLYAAKYAPHILSSCFVEVLIIHRTFEKYQWIQCGQYQCLTFKKLGAKYELLFARLTFIFSKNLTRVMEVLKSMTRMRIWVMKR
jgi:hypothetical protein